MTGPPHILIVDDDREIRDLLRDYLSGNGYRATAAADGRAMRTVLADQRIDLVILDLMLPGEDGLTLCRNLRTESTLPVIMLTARGEETDRIVGLEMGADDYVAKPFNPRELLARIKAVLRRAGTAQEGSGTGTERLRFANWVLDLGARELTDLNGVVVPLSSGEYRLLSVFVTHAGRVLSRDLLLDLTRGRQAQPFDRSIDVQVGRLRKRLEDDGQEPSLIKTVRGEGYVLTAEVVPETGSGR